MTPSSELSTSDYLRLSKAELIEQGTGDFIVQVGATEIGHRFPIKQVLDVEQAQLLDEPFIDTFVVDVVGRSVTALGSDADLNARWAPQVARFVDLVLDWLADASVDLAAQAFVTVSVTRGEEVNGEAHFDDGMFEPSAGVGAVAIVGDVAGCLVATTPLAQPTPRPNTLLTVDADQVAAFDGGATPRQRFPAEQVVIFPQFAQLHSGPGPQDGGIRHLMVMRVGTRPATTAQDC